MVFLDKFTPTLLYSPPDILEVFPSDFHDYEAVQQGESIVKVRAEHRCHEKPRLRRLRDASEFHIGAKLPASIIGCIRPLARAVSGREASGFSNRFFTKLG